MRRIYRLLVPLLVLILGLGGAPSALAQDDESPTASANGTVTFGDDSAAVSEPREPSGDSIIVRDPATGEALGSVAVTRVTQDITEVAPDYQVVEGFQHFAVEFTVENLSATDPFAFLGSEYILVSQNGLYVDPVPVSQENGTPDINPLYAHNIDVGLSMSGWMLYVTWGDIPVDGIYRFSESAVQQVISLSDEPVERPAVGESVTIVAAGDTPQITITVDEVITGYEEQTAVAPGDDYSFVAVGITIENVLSDAAYDFSKFALLFVDENGHATGVVGLAQGDAGDLTLLDDGAIPPGETVSGYLVFPVRRDADPAAIYFTAPITLATLVSFDG